MAIDKTIPKRLQADTDQRFLRPEVGEMMDAQNVMIAEDGPNSAGVIKNVPGTTAIAPGVALDRITDSDSVTVIGSASDPQRGYIYWFVADDSGASQDAIYRQDLNTSPSTYKLVLKSSSLAFSATSFIKVDVVNRNFQQDSTLQTVLYFTDNVNPPRKINVDRALAGGYAAVTDFDLAFSSIKAAPNIPPTSVFSQDTTIDTNMFTENAFQYATQYIYIDGEESAISPYSELATSKAMFFSSISDTGYAVSRNTENLCNINLQIDPNMPDLEKVRLLARNGNSGSFFVVDEFDPSVSKDRSDDGSTPTALYTASSQTYHFRNDTLGALVSTETVNKLYDNVPFLAQGQSVSGNRLMYSNYTEGRANTTPSVVLTPTYGLAGVSASDGIATSDVAGHITDPGGIKVDIEIMGLFGETSYDATDLVPAGSTTEISFVYKPLFNLAGASTIISIPLTADSPTASPLTSNSLELDTILSGYGDQTLTVTAHNTIAVHYNDLRTLLVSDLDEKFLTIEYNIAGQPLSTGTVTAGTAIVKFRFDAASAGFLNASTDGFLKLNPQVESVVLEGITLSDGNSWDNFQTLENDVLVAGTQSPSTPSGAHISDKAATSTAFGNIKSFKAGSTHELGVVYYDKFNRSGNVNRIGSFYSDWFGASHRPSTKDGPTSVIIDWGSYNPPSWADRYQIVYNGGSSYDSYVQYTTGGGFFATDPDDSFAAIPEKKVVYVSIDTLGEYQAEKDTLRSYSFTKGDKLRVVSYDASTSTTPNTTYPMSVDGGIIEFNILRVETLDATDNPIRGQTTPTEDEKGTFLVLEHPSVSSGVTDARYAGFDWFSLTDTTYVDSATTDPVGPVNYWGNRCVVELMTPKKTTSEDIFYEIGVSGRCGARKDTGITNEHGPDITIDNGDVKYRLVACKTPFIGAAAAEDTYAETIAAKNYEYRSIAIENETLTDKTSSKDWDKGRAHAVFENSATVRRYNGITYSDAYAEDVANLSLSSFNPSLSNFYSLESANGACNYIGSFGDRRLVALQENKMSMVPIDKDIISYAQGGSILGLSTDVLGEPTYYAGDYGCGDNPESVLIRDNQIFFVDSSRKKLLRFTSEGLSPISDGGVASIFESNLSSFLSEGGTRIVSGYDPRFNQYYVTLRLVGSYAGLTLGYNIDMSSWQSKYTFYPDMYADQDDMMYSALYTDPSGASNAEIFFSHDNATKNTFYGTYANSIIKLVSNYNPSLVKVFNAISHEGDSNNWTASAINTNMGSAGSSFSFSEKEGAYYSYITRDTGGTKHIVGVGDVGGATPSATQIVFANRVNRTSIPYGAAIKMVDSTNDQLDAIGTSSNDVTFSRFVDANTIEVTGTIDTSISGLATSSLVAVSTASVDGDPIRGHWAEITLTNNQTTGVELYCVNTHFVGSELDHSLGQQ